MTWEQIFSLVGALAMLGWSALIFLPRWHALQNAIRFGVVGILAVVYSTLIFVYFFRVEGGGFATLSQVRTLFASEPVLLAGWIHYLAFDLFIGVWIAERLDGMRLSRFLQAPILAATFLFGPFGLLMAFVPVVMGMRRWDALGSARVNP